MEDAREKMPFWDQRVYFSLNQHKYLKQQNEKNINSSCSPVFSIRKVSFSRLL